MTTMHWLLIFAVPLIGGLHHYAACLGYRNDCPSVAFGKAWRVAGMLMVIILLIVAWRLKDG